MSYFVLPFLLAHATDFFLVSNPYFRAEYLIFSKFFLEQNFNTFQRTFFFLTSKSDFLNLIFIARIQNLHILWGGKLKNWHLLWSRKSSNLKSFNKYLQQFVKLSHVEQPQKFESHCQWKPWVVQCSAKTPYTFRWSFMGWIPLTRHLSSLGLSVCQPLDFTLWTVFSGFVHLPCKTVPNYFFPNLNTDTNLPLRIPIEEDLRWVPRF